MDALLDLARQRNVHIADSPEATTTDVAIDIWLTAPGLLRERFAETVAFRQQNFGYYGGSGEPRDISKVNDESRVMIEEALDAWFIEHRRGRGSRIFFFPFHRGRIGILVRHGLSMRREASHDDDGGASIAFYRPQKHDVLVYDPRSDDIAVHAETKGEIKLYLSVLGRVLFGDENHFPPSDKFTLKPLVEDGSAALLCEDIDGLDRIRLSEIRRFWGGAYQELEIRKATDLFAALAARDQVIGKGGKLVAAVFRVKFTDSPKERAVTIRPPANAKYERNEDSALIEMWLARRGFMLNPPAEDEHDDLEVLARAG